MLRIESIFVGPNEHRPFSPSEFLLQSACVADLGDVFESFSLQTLGEGLAKDRKGDLGRPWLRMFPQASAGDLSSSLPTWTGLGTREF